ncbi:acyltransferase domain-containing protein [Sorangium sp. So ce131]|uniref:acyltransferase domain-containing protein n=1 Tax=Sorangium sp. So ce131 TaxID=3133282 RepID=UPI003F60673E
MALARLWASWGVSPGAVVGHSVGEVAAAHVAGALGLDEAARLVVLRGRVMQQATGRGKMALAMYSTVTQARVAGEGLDAAYWAKSLREPVRVAGAVARAIADGRRDFLEVGPHPVLTGNIEQCLLGRGEEGTALPTLRRGQDERRCQLQSLGALYTRGHAIDWKRLYPAGGGVCLCRPIPGSDSATGSSPRSPRRARGRLGPSLGRR